jgi:hypothetical protein
MRRLSTALALLCVLGTATPALAATSPVVSDCNSHGTLTRPYSAAQLKTALSTMPADVKEYTDCYDVVNRALLAQISTSHGSTGGSSSGGSGGSFLPTPVLVVLVLLALAAATLAALAIRRRGASSGS